MQQRKKNSIQKEISYLLKVPQKNIINISETKKGLYSKVFFAEAEGKKVVLKKKLVKKKYPQNTEKILLKYLELKGKKFSPKLIAKTNSLNIQERVIEKYFSRTDPEIISLANTLKDLHSLKFKKFGVFGKGRIRQRGTIKDFFEHWINSYKKYTAPNIKFFAKAKNTAFVKKWLPKIEHTIKKHQKIIKRYLTNSTNSIIHLDLHSENILKQKKGKIKIIDWDNAQVGDPALDIAAFLNIANLPRRQVKLFYLVYGTKNNKNFLERVKNYQILNQSFRVLSFARGLQGEWGPRADKKLIIERMSKNLSKFSELIKEPLPFEQSRLIIESLVYGMVIKK